MKLDYKTTRQANRLPLLLLTAASVALGQTADGAVLTSNAFSFSYGANVNSASGSATPTWTLNGGTSTTDGDFSFTPVLSGHSSSANGPRFDDRILTTTASGSSNYVGSGNGFGVTINASWSGDAATEFPGVDPSEIGIRLVITEIRIYALHYSNPLASGDASMRFLETTPDNVQSSNFTQLQKYSTPLTNLRFAENYNDVSWDPSDPWVVGTSSSRSFSLETLVGGASSNGLVDGFEVFGYIEVSQIPEPLTAGFVAIGVGVWVLTARRKRLPNA